MRLRDFESRALAFLIQNSDESTAVSFSGGKDSLVSLDLAYRVGIRKAVFVDTTIEFEETAQYVNQISEFYGTRIDVARPPLDFFQMIELVTAPSKRQRWCCEVMKFGPLSSWALENGIKKYVTGLRNEESSIRQGYHKVDTNPMVPVKQLNPILDWPEHIVWEYIHTYHLPVNPLYSCFKRIGCWCCPFKSSAEWAIISERFPKKMELLKTKLRDLANRLGIKDTQHFVDRYGWTYWIHPTKKVSIGSTTLCSEKNPSILISCDDKNLLDRIEGVLPLVTTRFRRVGKNVRIQLEDVTRKRVNILVEKAINCVGCGACLSYCTEGALEIVDGHISVKSELCTRCHKCLDASTLKGSCIARHYMPKRSYLTTIP